MGNDIQAWRETAEDLALTVVTGPDGREIVIFNREHIGRGYLWVSETRLISSYSPDEAPTDRDAGGALATLGRLARK